MTPPRTLPAPPRPIPAPDPPPPRWVPARPLPAYRYVPGLNPHPLRHPQGHSWTGGGAPPAPRWEGDPVELRWGLDLLAARYPWECHEHFEGLWRPLPRDTPTSWWLQGLIQAAAAALKRHLGQEQAALTLLDAALGRLERARVAPPLPELDLDALIAELEALRVGSAWPCPQRRQG